MPLPTIDEKILDEAQVLKLRRQKAYIDTADKRIQLAKEELKAARGERHDEEEKLFTMIQNLNQPELKFQGGTGGGCAVEGRCLRRAA